MSKINLLLLSDIHFKNAYPENEGKVLTAFVNDLQETMNVDEKEYNYCTELSQVNIHSSSD